MPTGFTPRGMTPFDAVRVARGRKPKRYAAIGFTVIAIYFFGTLVVSVIRFGPSLQAPLDAAKPPPLPQIESPDAGAGASNTVKPE